MSADSRLPIGDSDRNSVRKGILFLLVGLAVIGYGGFDYVTQQQAIDSGVSVNATILETGVEADGTGSSTGVEHYPTVRFEYVYQGERYTSTKIYPSSVRRAYDTESAARDAIEEYETNTTVTAYTTPDSPGNAFLRTEESNGPIIAIGIGIVFVLLGGRSVLKES
ncbi:Protein of unknown function [Halopenitus malekzadehii]|uniref:DUF3592 domain-containing protein n=1 Tax=Halopenitus malekzadehii TaxID=1267564 RepID=A0A1H6K480_9EURY|nr:DUF3592 domain-containing protein [Halopenitus malekzadehii]SEH68082.1 Protein of unknown function [Halopenitus malekzadehii]